MITEKFNVHGTFAKSNIGGIEVEISKSNDAARFRMSWLGHDSEEPTDWLEINYTDVGDPFCILPNGDIEYLNNYVTCS